MKLPANIDNNKTMGLLLSLVDTPLCNSMNELLKQGWQIFVVSQSRGRCYYGPKYITIPAWALKRKEHNYWLWYVAHEFAHAYTAGDNHGQRFMRKLKEICPTDCVHFELGYKPQNATIAGISESETKGQLHTFSDSMYDL
jgi:hypothetical protein